MPDYEKELEKYEKSVEDHVKKVNSQLDEDLANIKKKFKEKTELLKTMENENRKMEEQNERMRNRMELRKKKMENFERQIIKNQDQQLSFEANISEIQEKLPQRQKNIDEILKSLNEKRGEVIQKQHELACFQTNKTEKSLKWKREKTKRKMEEARKKKITQDKRIASLRVDITKSEKSFDKIEKEIRKEIERQFENESKKDEIERRIKIFEVENTGISDEFQKLLAKLNENSELKEKSNERRLGELQVLMAKGTKYLEKLEEKIKETKCAPSKNNSKIVSRASLHSLKPPILRKQKSRRSKSETTTSSESWKRLEELKKQIIQLKRESEALSMEKSRLKEEKESLEKTMNEYEKQADRAAKELRNAENFRISELNQQERKLQPSILIESKSEKQTKLDIEQKQKLREKIEKLEKTTGEQKEELEKLRRRSEFLRRQLRAHSETDLVQFENERNEKGAELRALKKTCHEEIMTLNALNKKLQQRVLQREAALTKANSVVYLTTNVREERNREIEELHKEIEKKQKQL